MVELGDVIDTWPGERLCTVQWRVPDSLRAGVRVKECGRLAEHEGPCIERGSEDYCHRCHGTNVIWSAPSPLWNEVMRSGSINEGERYDGIICPTCFIELAEKFGITNWRLIAERVPMPLQTVTPSGRVWDEQLWLWREPT
jgi:hypothetical protein